MKYNPFLDPEAEFDRGLKVKDIVKKELPAKPKKPPIPPAGSARFRLEDLADRWRIHGVKYRNGIYRVDLGKALLCDGAKKTQDEWIAYSQQAASQGELYVPNAHLYHSICATAHHNKDNPQYQTLIECIRTALQTDFKNYWMATLSRVKYQPRSTDEVIHDIGLPSQYTIKKDIVGPDQYITQGTNAAALNALLGDNDPQHTNTVYNWIAGKNTYLWRRNSKPKKTEPRLVSLGVGFGSGFNLSAYGGISSRRPARGVGTQKIFQRK